MVEVWIDDIHVFDFHSLKEANKWGEFLICTTLDCCIAVVVLD